MEAITLVVVYAAGRTFMGRASIDGLAKARCGDMLGLRDAIEIGLIRIPAMKQPALTGGQPDLIVQNVTSHHYPDGLSCAVPTLHLRVDGYHHTSRLPPELRSELERVYGAIVGAGEQDDEPASNRGPSLADHADSVVVAQ